MNVAFVRVFVALFLGGFTADFYGLNGLLVPDFLDCMDREYCAKQSETA